MRRKIEIIDKADDEEIALEEVFVLFEKYQEEFLMLSSNLNKRKIIFFTI